MTGKKDYDVVIRQGIGGLSAVKKMTRPGRSRLTKPFRIIRGARCNQL
jgi:hypothetical protein